jgi:hypothetical protein
MLHFFPHGAKIRPFSGKCQEKKEQKKTIFPEKISGRVLNSGKKEGRRVVEPCFRGGGRGLAAAATTRDSVWLAEQII